MLRICAHALPGMGDSIGEGCGSGDAIYFVDVAVLVTSGSSGQRWPPRGGHHDVTAK